jgi:hypothetical protein
LILTEANPVDYFDVFAAFDAYLQIPYNIYTVYDSCWDAMLEIYMLSLNYIEFATDLKILWFNMIYNMGSAIKSVSNLVMFFLA